MLQIYELYDDNINDCSGRERAPIMTVDVLRKRPPREWYLGRCINTVHKYETGRTSWAFSKASPRPLAPQCYVQTPT